MSDPILITGCARSGTSMVAGIINLSGAEGGAMTGPRDHNAKGQFENERIRGIVKAYLHDHNWDPMGQDPLPQIGRVFLHSGDPCRVGNWCDLITETMESQSVDLEQPWFYKGAKMCLMWSLWDRAFPEAKWIIVRRDRPLIIESCLRTHFMRAYKDRSGWGGWVDQHIKRFDEMHETMTTRCRSVWSDQIVDGNFRGIESVVRWAGLEWSEDLVRGFVDPDLYTRTLEEVE